MLTPLSCAIMNEERKIAAAPTAAAITWATDAPTAGAPSGSAKPQPIASAAMRAAVEAEALTAM